MKYETFQQKLDRFKSEPIGFLVKSKEIADELAKVFDREGVKPWSLKSTKEFMAIALDNAKGYPGDAYVCYNVKGYEGNLMYETSDFTSECKRELLDVTLDELKEYLESSPMKITIETDGHHKTTAECNGITTESLCNPADEFKLPKGVHMAVQRLLEKLEGHKEDTGFHVGDTVEVVGCHNEFLKDVVGKRGVVTRIDEYSREKYEIKYEEHISGNDKWWSHPEELKLISKEDTGFHVGDIVEVVANEAGFGDYPIGLQGVVKAIDTDGAHVKLLTYERSWYFWKRELKLIRRGNN